MRLIIDKLVYGGVGMATVEGRKVFVPFSAPGDELEVEIVEDHKEFARAQITKVITLSPLRITPQCKVFGQCGGCQWQHISYNTQLEWKKIILVETLKRIGKIPEPCVLDTLPSPKQWHYRNKIQLHVDSKGRVGFYKPNSKEVVEFDECKIAHEQINADLKKNRAEFSKRDRGVSLKVEDGPSFVQVNSEQNENLKNLLVEWLKEVPHKKILELYAGSGNFTFEIAKIAEQVVASDIDKHAIELAKKEQVRLNLCNVEFLHAKDARAIRRLKSGCDVVIVDPPRGGCEGALNPILELGANSIIYISCNPATLARDAIKILANGYRMARCQSVDMFPQTFHIESVTLFSRK